MLNQTHDVRIKQYVEAVIKGREQFAVINCDYKDITIRLHGKCNLVFADPPFNIGRKYDVHDDKMEQDKFESWTGDWVQRCSNTLCKGGTICLHGNDYLADIYVRESSYLNLERRDWIIWYYRFAQCQKVDSSSGFLSAHCHCIVSGVPPKEQWTWNPYDVLVESDRATKYKDKRTEKSSTPGKRIPLDVWGPDDGKNWCRIQGNNKERRPGHNNQLPEKYMERIILAYSNPNDLLFDPFCGSGTFATVAVALGRRVITCDVSQEYCSSAWDRITDGPVHIG